MTINCIYLIGAHRLCCNQVMNFLEAILSHADIT